MIYARHGLAVRVVYLLIACVAYALSGFGRLFAGKRVVLCYHGVSAAHAGRFREQMTHLSRSRVPDPSGNGACVPRRHLPAVCVTFDDAFENLVQNALPVLDEFRIPAVIFAVPGNLGKTPQWDIPPSHSEYREKVMTAEQLRRTCGRNIVVGSHTQTHRALAKLSCEQIRWELTEAKRNLQELVGQPVDELAFPYGEGNDAVVEIARDVGYKRIYTTEPRLCVPESREDVIGRFSMSPAVWPIEFRLTCAGAYAWLGPWRKCVRAMRRRILRRG